LACELKTIIEVRKFPFAFSLILVTNFGATNVKFNVHKIYMHVYMNVSCVSMINKRCVSACVCNYSALENFFPQVINSSEKQSKIVLIVPYVQ
jgi:hypothetical protein